MSDLIRRQDVIDALLKIDSIVTEERVEEMYTTVNDLISGYKGLKDDIDLHMKNYSSAQRKGRWIQNEQYEDRYKCSSCGREAWYPRFMSVFIEDYKFCPNCGSRNEVEKNDET